MTLLWCPRSSQSPEKTEILEGEKEPSGKREKPVVRPEEIPPVPENRFLLRRDAPSQEEKTEASVAIAVEITTFYQSQIDLNSNVFRVENQEAFLPADQKPAVSKSGRKIRGRGTMVFSNQFLCSHCLHFSIYARTIHVVYQFSWFTFIIIFI